jgi:hypothetical protein
MSKTTSLFLATCLSLPGSILAQEPAAPVPAAPASNTKLKPEQAANVLKQLKELEATILAQRGTNLGSIVQKLRSAASSDAAALSLVAECDTIVNVDRKIGDREAKEDAERRREQQKNAQQNTDNDEEEKNGDSTLALRLCLEYLALSLEAQEAKSLADMAGKLQAFHQSLISSGSKLHGRAGEMIMRSIGAAGGGGGRQGGGVPPGSIGLVVQAFQLENYIKREDWPQVPGDIIDQYRKVILAADKVKSPDKLAQDWEAAITAEASFRKERMFEGEYNLWLQTALPDLRWQRALEMVDSTSTPINGLAEMLNIIKANPNHPDSPRWVSQLRSMVENDQGTASTPAGSP